jgi:hypothetical protein
MATFFQTPGSGQLSEEEKQFKGIDYDYTKKLTPEEGYENIQQFIGPIVDSLKQAGESVQYNNIVNMSGADVPSFDQIQSMDINQLNQLKMDIEAKQKSSASDAFGSAYQIAIQQIERALLNKQSIAPNNVSSANEVQTDQGSAEFETEENKVINASTAESINNEGSFYIDAFNNAASASEEITANSQFANVEGQPDQVNVVADGSLVGQNTKGASVVAKDEFDKGKGELELEKNASNKEITEDDTNNAIAKIKEELKGVIPEEELPTNLLLLKFGANLLRARSNKRGALPKFLDELGQSLAPITDTLIAYDIKKKEADRALALQAYEIYEDRAERDAKRYEFEDLYNVFAADYDKKGGGILKGGTTLIGQATTAAELDYFKSMRYPDQASVESGIHSQEQLDNTPGHLQGLPMFVISKTTGSAETVSPTFGGYGAGDKTAIRSAFEFGGMLEDGIRNDVQLYQMITLGMQEGNTPLAGPGAGLARWTQVTAGKLNTIAKFFGVDAGIPMLNKLAGEDEYKQFYAAMDAAGVNLNPSAIKASITQDVTAMYQYNDAALSSQSISDEEWNYNNQQIQVLDQMSRDLAQRDDLNIVVALMQKSAFTRARYLQGTNRLLKDVINEARDIMNVLNKSEREALSILGENIQNYTRKYEQQLQIIYDPSTQTEEYNKRLITIDDNFNVSGGLSNINVGNMSNDVLGDQMNLNDVQTSQEVGEYMEFESLEDVLKGYGIEMPEELR